jgi:CHAD domain-containing protein
MNPSDISVCSFGADVILKYLDAFNQEIDGVISGNSIESIHRMRVASRKLNVALSTFEECFPSKNFLNWKKYFQTTRSSLGSARDLDVKIDLLLSLPGELPEKKMLSGINRSILRLKQKRAEQQKYIIQALELLQEKKSIDQLKKQCDDLIKLKGAESAFSNKLYLLANKTISDNIDQVIFFEKYIPNPDCIKEIHALRIAMKRLRYSIDIFSPLYPDKLKKYFESARIAQEMLGTIHDCDVWILSLPEFLKKEEKRIVRFYGNARNFKHLVIGIQYFLKNRQDTRNQTYNDFSSQWIQWKQDKLWENLVNTVGKYTIEYDFRYNPA